MRKYRLLPETHSDLGIKRLPQQTSGSRGALSPDPTGLTSKELDALRQGIEALPPKSKLALLMVRQDGASYDEVARKLGVTTNTARNLVERAMEYLLEVVPEEKRSSG